MRSISLNPGVDLTGVDFATGLAGRIYRDGALIATPSSVAVVPDSSDPTRGHITGLPADKASTYALTLVQSGFGGVHYWSGAGDLHHSWRVIPDRRTGLSSTDLGLDLFHLVAGVPQVHGVTLTVAEAVAGDGDYLVSGWPRTDGSWSLVYEAGGFRFSENWEVRGAALATDWIAADRATFRAAMAKADTGGTFAPALPGYLGAYEQGALPPEWETSLGDTSEPRCFLTYHLARADPGRNGGNADPDRIWVARIDAHWQMAVGQVLDAPTLADRLHFQAVLALEDSQGAGGMCYATSARRALEDRPSPHSPFTSRPLELEALSG